MILIFILVILVAFLVFLFRKSAFFHMKFFTALFGLLLNDIFFLSLMISSRFLRIKILLGGVLIIGVGICIMGVWWRQVIVLWRCHLCDFCLNRVLIWMVMILWFLWMIWIWICMHHGIVLNRVLLTLIWIELHASYHRNGSKTKIVDSHIDLVKLNLMKLRYILCSVGIYILRCVCKWLFLLLRCSIFSLIKFTLFITDRWCIDLSHWMSTQISNGALPLANILWHHDDWHHLVTVNYGLHGFCSVYFRKSRCISIFFFWTFLLSR